MGNLVYHAKRELEIAFPDGEDDEIQIEMNEHIIRLIELFSKADHSGFSAEYVLQIFERLSRFLPLSLLLGIDSEWNEVEPGVYQNNRCSTVFKDGKDGQAYDIDYKIFTDDKVVFYSNKESKEYITFPYSKRTSPIHIWKHSDGTEEKI